MKVKLTPDGQVEIPTQVQQQLGIQAGDELLLVCTGTEILLRAIKPKRLSEFYGVLPVNIPYPGKESVRQQAGETFWRESATES
ncbi:AbrB/MazE/SpoVT family DNA-binding domain-containing protein [Oscillatoria sp. FACHB-1406]|uniref:AbrB/MazE/SpoVT family DNA-binding domain-containing protein n=1 Tax=Oscillatoria sp. FACHB-1406 TaxID=2692846 RepID=UPI0016831D1A|nr:AbrB/MazE/SpoVT family DNA-binding domain-containing protein [Oscillatoria sp. FACHB-1406]MBD2578644.1 AbrB/MazE/SpoVT family DNA-binding domain-containing protein [Oscillatoria sp. FACHB-1406]